MSQHRSVPGFGCSLRILPGGALYIDVTLVGGDAVGRATCAYTRDEVDAIIAELVAMKSVMIVCGERLQPVYYKSVN